MKSNYSVNRTQTRYAGSRRLPQALGFCKGGRVGRSRTNFERHSNGFCRRRSVALVQINYGLGSPGTGQRGWCGANSGRLCVCSNCYSAKHLEPSRSCGSSHRGLFSGGWPRGIIGGNLTTRSRRTVSPPLNSSVRQMTGLSSLLRSGANEIRQCSDLGFERAWLDRLGIRMEHAASAPPVVREREVTAIAHALTDTGPLGESACPSFWQVFGYYRRQGKRTSSRRVA